MGFCSVIFPLAFFTRPTVWINVSLGIRSAGRRRAGTLAASALFPPPPKKALLATSVALNGALPCLAARQVALSNFIVGR